MMTNTVPDSVTTKDIPLRQYVTEKYLRSFDGMAEAARLEARNRFLQEELIVVKSEDDMDEQDEGSSDEEPPVVGTTTMVAQSASRPTISQSTTQTTSTTQEQSKQEGSGKTSHLQEAIEPLRSAHTEGVHTMEVSQSPLSATDTHESSGEEYFDDYFANFEELTATETETSATFSSSYTSSGTSKKSMSKKSRHHSRSTKVKSTQVHAPFTSGDVQEIL